MIIYVNDYWKDFGDQGTGSKPIDKVEIEMTAGVWTDITDYYLGGATYDQEKERAPDKISAGDTRYSFDNSDNYFTRTDSGSIFYGTIFHNKKIKFSEGFYGLGYHPQSVMYIKDVKWNHNNQRCYIYCQEAIQRLVDENLNPYPAALVAVANAGNTGNGTITEIETLPFATVNNGWTLTCDGNGGDAVGTFDVVKDGVGSIGTATSGTEFSSAAHGIKFTISSGVVTWIIGDIFTFTAKQYPEWTTTNPGKIIWNILTGYNYDTDVQDNWNASVFTFDHTLSTANTDINYTSFVNAIADITNNLTGYINYDRNAAEVIEEIIIHFLGAIYTDNEGKIALYAYKPNFGGLLLKEFSDDKKIFELNASEDTAKMINQVSVYCKRSASWAWSGDSETTNDIYSVTNTLSIADYGLKNPINYYDYYWHSVNRAAQEWWADRIVDKYGNPPLELEFETGLDALRTNLGDIVKVNDDRTSIANQILEVNKIEKDFEAIPKVINITGSDANTAGFNWMFYGSSADEGDGISPQAANYDSATISDKQFGYFSQTGGEGSDPEYYYF